MRTQTSQKAELFARALRTTVLGVFAVFLSLFIAFSLLSVRTAAATNSTVNFQARLENAAGAIAPDGNYNVEFKLYDASTSSGSSQGSCTGDVHCLWTETRTSGNVVHVANGYLTVNLGSVSAFSGSTNWSQQLWLTMNIGGTGGSPSWDGEMSPRLLLTATPYAFQAGGLSKTDGSGNKGVLGFNTVANNPNITLPDATGTVCLQSSSSCGFITGSGSAFLQGGNSFGAQAVLGTNDGNSLAFRTNGTNRLVLDTSGNIQFQQASTVNIASATTGTALTIQGGAATSGTNVGGNLLLQGGAGASTGASGSVIVKSNTNNSTTAFQVQNASGTGIVLSADTVNKRVGVGTASPSTDLHVLSSDGSIGGVLFENTNSDTGTNFTDIVLRRSVNANGAGAGVGFQLQNSTGSTIQYGFIGGQIQSNSSGSEQGALGFYVRNGSTNNSKIVDINGSGMIVGPGMATTTHASWVLQVIGDTDGNAIGPLVVQTNSAGSIGAALTLDAATNSTGGHKWSFLSTGPGAAVGAGVFSAFDGTANAYRMFIDTNGNTTFGSNSIPGNAAKLNVNGGISTYGGYGPTTLIGGSPSNLEIGAGGSSPNAASLSWGDGSGWKLNFGPVVSSAFVPKVSFFDTGNIQFQQASTVNIASATTGTALTIQGGAATSGTNVGGNLLLQGGAGASTGASGSVIVKSNTNNSTTAFQVQNASGTSIFGVDTSGNKAVLGSSNALSGSLLFYDSGDTNTITLAAPATTTASYTLTLPTSSPNAGLCLETSATDSTKLVFSSCANSNASISFVTQQSYFTSGSATTSFSYTPTTVGDLLVLSTDIPNNSSSGITSVGTGGSCVGGWTKVKTSAPAGSYHRVEMWMATVTSTTCSSFSVTYNSGSGNSNEINVSEYTASGVSSSTTWGVDISGATGSTSSVGTITWSALTSGVTGEAYIGYAQSQNGASTGGCATNFTCVVTSHSNALTYDVSTVGNTAYTPTQSQTSGQYNSVGALFVAYISSVAINNQTSTQQGNFNVQAATSGSVAGTLEAASSGTGDIFNLLNGSGTTVGRFSSTGEATFEPSTSSATAFQVQNQSGVNVFNVDTSGLKVNIGAGATGEATPSLLVLDSKTGSSSDPATEVDGAMYYNATSQSFRCGVQGAWVSCFGLLYSNTSSSSGIGGCTTACAAFNTVPAVPANYCQAGRVITIRALGSYSSASNPTLAFGVYYGTDGTTRTNDTQIGVTTPAVATINGGSGVYFEFDFTIICQSTTSMIGNGVYYLQTATFPTGMTVTAANTATATTVTGTNAAKNLYIFPTWGSNAGGNSAQINELIVSGQ